MSLHGEIKINGDTIAEWSARRVDFLLDYDQDSLYTCYYQEFDQAQNQTGIIVATIEHRYSHGAAALAAKVLTLAESGW